MNLCLDIGNSKVRAAVFGDGRVMEDRTFDQSGRDLGARMSAVFKEWSKKYGIINIGAVSVAPKVARLAVGQAGRFFSAGVVMITAESFPKGTVKYRRPERLGSDRIINAYAAHKLYGGPSVVVDIGTAITWDLVDAKGRFLGGAIAPGPGTMGRALLKNTAALPLVRLERKPRPLGHDTRECIESGLYWGTLGMIRELISACSRGMKGKIKLVFTGGLGRMFAKEFKGAIADELLTLKGVDLFLRSRDKITNSKNTKQKKS